MRKFGKQRRSRGLRSEPPALRSRAAESEQLLRLLLGPNQARRLRHQGHLLFYIARPIATAAAAAACKLASSPISPLRRRPALTDHGGTGSVCVRVYVRSYYCYCHFSQCSRRVQCQWPNELSNERTNKSIPIASVSNSHTFA